MFIHEYFRAVQSSEITHMKIDQLIRTYRSLTVSEASKALEIIALFEGLDAESSKKFNDHDPTHFSIWYALKPTTLIAFDAYLKGIGPIASVNLTDNSSQTIAKSSELPNSPPNEGKLQSSRAQNDDGDLIMLESDESTNLIDLTAPDNDKVAIISIGTPPQPHHPDSDPQQSSKQKQQQKVKESEQSVHVHAQTEMAEQQNSKPETGDTDFANTNICGFSPTTLIALTPHCLPNTGKENEPPASSSAERKCFLLLRFYM